MNLTDWLSEQAAREYDKLSREFHGEFGIRTTYLCQKCVAFKGKKK